MKQSMTQRSVLSELRVLWAFNMRELITYTRYPLNFVFDLLTEPLYIFNWLLIGMFYVGGPSSQNLMAVAGTGDYISYLFLGGLLLSFGRGAIDVVGNSLRIEMMMGTLESCWITPISRFTMLTSYLFMNLTGMSIFNLFTGGLIYVLFNPTWHLDWVGIAVILVVTLLSNYAFGILMAGVVMVFKQVWYIRRVFTSIVWLLAGATFPIEALPSWAQSISRVIPYYYSLRDLRAVILRGVTLSELTGDFILLLAFAAVSLVLSYALFKRLERVARHAGTLGLY